jgi:aspartyl/glutamyl-tRNA(Asn/Gln) amidotransferase C subunit
MSSAFSTDLVKHIAELANIPVSEKELQPLAKAFSETISVVKNLREPDTSKTEPVHQVTGLENVMREDVVDESRMFTQAEALANASETYEGYIKVKAVLKNK